MMASAFNDAHSFVIAARTKPNGPEASLLAGRRSLGILCSLAAPRHLQQNLPASDCFTRTKKELFGAVERNESDLNVDGGNKSVNDEKEITRECQE